MKVIDLLNKMAENENYRPKKIIFGCWEYTFDGIEYQNNYIMDRSGLLLHWCLEKILNDEVEIIEEEPEIDIQGIEELDVTLELKSVNTEVSREENLKRIDKTAVDYFYRISDLTKQQNQILKALKQLDNKINGK